MLNYTLNLKIYGFMDVTAFLVDVTGYFAY